MIIGRTPSGAIKIKTDGGLRAVGCACCGGDECAPFPYTETLGSFLYGSINDMWSKAKLDAWWDKPYTVNANIQARGRSYNLSITVPVTCKYEQISSGQYTSDYDYWEVLGPPDEEGNELMLEFNEINIELFGRRNSGKYDQGSDPFLYGAQSHLEYAGSDGIGRNHFGAYVSIYHSEIDSSKNYSVEVYYFFPNAQGLPNGSFYGTLTPPIQRVICSDPIHGDFVFQQVPYVDKTGGSAIVPTCNFTVTRP